MSSGANISPGLVEDLLLFLTSTVIVVPLFKRLKLSPILGFLLAGFLLKVFGCLQDLEDISAISDLGVLFLLFEMGLELNTERLSALARFAFGVGLPQVLLTAGAFAWLSSPPYSIGEQVLETVFNAPAPLVTIRTMDEAVVIGAALSLSSSAFVLQLLQERGELPTRYGAGALGVLLMQDIVVVPLLVLLPLIEAAGGIESDFGSSGLLAEAGPAALKAIGSLGLVVLASRTVLRKAFDLVAEARSTEAFVSLCLLTVAGTSFITDKIGFSDTLGAFLAGVLLAESNYRQQVEVDIKPYKGILLGLFFLSTGATVDPAIITRDWPSILALLAGLIVVKAAILTPIAKIGGNLSWEDSLRLGLVLSQGGEFAFVLLALANELGVLPSELNRLLIVVVVLSMALTPTLADVGKVASDAIKRLSPQPDPEPEGPCEPLLSPAEARACGTRPIVVCGAGPIGMAVATMLSSPLAEVEQMTRQAPGGGKRGLVILDYNPARLPPATALGFSTMMCGDTSGDILRSAESRIDNPTAVVVCFGNRVRSVETVRSVKVNHPGVPILARAKNSAHAAELRAAGADTVVTQTLDTGLELGTRLMTTMGIPLDETAYLVNAIRAADIPPVSAIGPEVGEGPPQPPESAMEGLDVDTKHDVRAIASQMAVVRSTSPTNGFRRVREMSEDESDDGESSEPVFRRSNSPIPGERGIMPGGDEISVSVGKKREEK